MNEEKTKRGRREERREGPTYSFACYVMACAVYNVRCTLYMCAVCGVRCTLYMCTLYMCAVCGVHCVVFSVRCCILIPV